MALAVRPKRAADDNFILALSQQVFAEYSAAPIAAARSMLADEGAACAVAEVGQVKVGFVLLSIARLGRELGPWPNPATAYVNAIAVRPNAQGRGVGTRLLDYAEQMARGRGAVVLSLTTADTNGRAQRLFEAAGFLPVLRLPEHYAHGQDAITMFKPLI